MQYRSFGTHGFDSSIIGFGAMRLPLLEGGSQNDVDEESSIRLIRKAIDLGVNYIDTAYVYHGGKSEEVVGKALRGGYRNRVTLVDKSPIWLVETYEDFEKYLNIQLKRLQTDCIDVYLLHGLNLESWQRIEALGATRFLDEQIDKGTIKVAGFSFHDSYENFMEIVNAYQWGMTLLQMNYMDEFEQATLKGIAYAGEIGLPVAIMEPLKGGLLASAPKDVSEIMASRQPSWSPVEWSFRWLAHRPEVKVILSGMSSEAQLNENVHIGDRLIPLNFQTEDFAAIGGMRKAYQSRIKVKCTQCQYCMPCPVGVDIPGIFELYNTGGIYENQAHVTYLYNRFVDEAARAKQCVSCKKCETACPQHIEIAKVLSEAELYLSGENL